MHFCEAINDCLKYDTISRHSDVVVQVEYTYAPHSLRSEARSFLAIHYVASLITNFVRLDPTNNTPNCLPAYPLISSIVRRSKNHY